MNENVFKVIHGYHRLYGLVQEMISQNSIVVLVEKIGFGKLNYHHKEHKYVHIHRLIMKARLLLNIALLDILKVIANKILREDGIASGQDNHHLKYHSHVLTL